MGVTVWRFLKGGGKSRRHNDARLNNSLFTKKCEFNSKIPAMCFTGNVKYLGKLEITAKANTA